MVEALEAAAVVVKIVMAQSAGTTVAEAAHWIEAHWSVAQVTTTLTQREVALAVAVADALMGATITDEAAMVSAWITHAMSGAIRVIQNRAVDGNGARMIAAMDARGMRRGAITRGAGLRSVGAALRARMCVAATS
jgi:hypothetical protein